MSFSPMLPMSGYAGWSFLQRTQDRQMALFTRTPAIERDVSQFKARIASVTDVQQLMSDRSLLRVALGAFGLEDRINDRFYLSRVFAEGTAQPDSFANKISDRRFREMSEAFGFGNPGGPNVTQSDFAQRITEAFRARQFEKAIGTQDESMRLAMNMQRELARISGSERSDNAQWFELMGNPPLRRFMETALGLPREMANLDLDRQRQVFRDATQKLLGTSALRDLADPAMQDKMLRRFFARAQIESGPAPGTPGLAALTLLGGGVSPWSGLVQSGPLQLVQTRLWGG